jgi:hypothetical protein
LIKVTVMALQTEQRKIEQTPRVTIPVVPTTQSAASPPAEQAPPAFRADVWIFMLWMGCFLLVASMIVYETVVGLFLRR